MLVILRLLPVSVMRVVCVFPVLHAVLYLLLESVHAPEHGEYAHVGVKPVGDFLQPCLGLSAVADEQVAGIYAEDILRTRLKAVRLRPGRDEQRNVRPLARDAPRKIVGRENGGDDIQPVRRRLLRLRAAAAERKHAGGYYKGDNFLHRTPLSRFMTS